MIQASKKTKTKGKSKGNTDNVEDDDEDDDAPKIAGLENLTAKMASAEEEWDDPKANKGKKAKKGANKKGERQLEKQLYIV